MLYYATIGYFSNRRDFNPLEMGDCYDNVRNSIVPLFTTSKEKTVLREFTVILL